MRQKLHDAIESARTVGGPRAATCQRASPQRYRSFHSVRAIVLAVLQNAPANMSVMELCDELNIMAVQTEDA